MYEQKQTITQSIRSGVSDPQIVNLPHIKLS